MYYYYLCYTTIALGLLVEIDVSVDLKLSY